MKSQQALNILLAAALSLLTACDVPDIDVSSIESMKSSVKEVIGDHSGLQRDLQSALNDFRKEVESLTALELMNMNFQDMEARAQAEAMSLLEGMTAEELIVQLRGMTVEEILAQAPEAMTVEEIVGEIRGMTADEVLAKLRDTDRN